MRRKITALLLDLEAARGGGAEGLRRAGNQGAVLEDGSLQVDEERADSGERAHAESPGGALIVS